MEGRWSPPPTGTRFSSPARARPFSSRLAGARLLVSAPAEVRERYGVDPHQVVDFIALRGDPSDKIPGARGIGEKRAADLLAEYGSLEAMLEDGRFAAEADALRLFRRIATLDRSAPLPPLPDQAPNWTAAAARARELGLAGLVRDFEKAASWT